MYMQFTRAFDHSREIKDVDGHSRSKDERHVSAMVLQTGSSHEFSALTHFFWPWDFGAADILIELQSGIETWLLNVKCTI